MKRVSAIDIQIKRVEWQLFDHEQVPLVFREIGIRTGYRNPSSSTKDCIRSAFRSHNETVNFWTHFLPTFYFVWTLNGFCSDDNFIYDPYNWPLIGYLITVCTMPLISSAAHMFSVMSENARHICFFSDYSSICWYGFGAGVAYQAYAFDEQYFNSKYRLLFLPTVGGLSVFSTYLACSSRFVKNIKRKKIMRLSAFALPYLSSSYPLMLRLMKCHNNNDWSEPGACLHFKHFLFAFSSIAIYSLHIPECLAPGQFDILGHSHQIFHIVGMIATYMQVWGCYTDLRNRRAEMEANLPPTGLLSVILMTLVLVCNVSIVMYFSIRLIKRLSHPTLSVVEFATLKDENSVSLPPLSNDNDGDGDERRFNDSTCSETQFVISSVRFVDTETKIDSLKED